MVASSVRIVPLVSTIILAAFVCALSALWGCSSVIVDPGAQPTGALSGRVLLYDGSGNTLSSDSGVAVSIASVFAAVTNDSGKWILPALQPGTRDLYNLTFTEPGFGSVMQFNDSAITNDTTQVPTVVLSEAPALSVGLQTVQIIAQRTVTFNCSMPKSENLSIVFCMSTDSALLAANPDQAEWTFLTTGAGSGYDGGFETSSDSILSVDTIAHGTVIYTTVCVAGNGANYQAFSHYFDPVAKREVYSALGPHSRILSMRVP